MGLFCSVPAHAVIKKKWQWKKQKQTKNKRKQQKQIDFVSW